MYDSSDNGGYIALFSVVIITAVLMTVLLATNAGGFVNSSMILQTTIKEEVTSHAEGCVDLVRGKLAQDSTYNGEPNNKAIYIQDTQCVIYEPNRDTPGEIVIDVKTLAPGTSNIAVNIQAIVDENTLEYISWKELPN